MMKAGRGIDLTSLEPILAGEVLTLGTADILKQRTIVRYKCSVFLWECVKAPVYVLTFRSKRRYHFLVSVLHAANLQRRL